MYKIEWMGDKVKNFESRRGVKPFVIVDHISAGTKSSMKYTFENPANQVSSHFDVGRDGSIWQYVRIEDTAWTQGLTVDMIQRATAPVVKDMNSNPNYYCVSIEHEGWGDNGGDGTLTEEQFYASAWLHRYIMDYCNHTFGVNMNLSNYNVIGHFQIDPKRKPNCPGPNFPWQRLRAELAIAEKMTLKEYEMRLDYMNSGLYTTENAVRVASRVSDLYSKLNGKWSEEAKQKLLLIGKFMKENDLFE
ncbi:N-acetylmuramoyl-L-alanine amidase [Paenibacillus chitinolyticus]|uniref:N-acetylmuramoyl-L-alanine amidase n=1 Tax=Paenibacillus chitinolyticus TaxID=79263 RepID=UPI0036DB2086